MKRIYQSLFILSLLSTTVSCEEFLDRPAHNMTAAVDISDISLLSSSVYSSFIGVSGTQGNAMISFGEVASDNMMRGSTLSSSGGLDAGKTYNAFQNMLNITPASLIYLEAIWDGIYPVIEQANVNIRAIDAYFADESAEVRKAFQSENKVMRAWLYMFLVNTYGRPLVIPEKEMTPKEYSELVNDKSTLEIYDIIIDDLRDAVEHIPTKSEWFDLYNLYWQGRAHLGSAQGLLAKALLYKASNEIYFNSDYTTADECYKEIVEIVTAMNSEYTLYGDYEALFRATGNYSEESLLEIGTLSTSDGTTSYKGFRHSQPRNYTGYGFNAPTHNLINQYERDGSGVIIDDRYRGTVVFGSTNYFSGMSYPSQDDFMRQINGDVMTGNATTSALSCGFPNRWSRKSAHPKPTSTAASNGGMDNFGGNNLKLLRFGEVLLIGAEAAYHAGDETTAKSFLKIVRTRAKLTNTDIDQLTGQPLLDQIWKDKRLEIATEWSNRYFELVRIDKINPGYMMAAMEAKANDELAAMRAHIEDTNAWAALYQTSLPITKENFESLMPIANGLSIPKHYTMPISSKVFTEMLNLEQTQYYR